FEQMEMEFFVPPDEGPKWFEYWCQERLRWYIDLGIPEDLLRMRQHDAEELSHYSSGTADVEFLFPFGWGELEGVANRGDYDLTQHAKFSGERLEYFDQASGERYVPHVIEPAAGVGRSMMAFLLAAYDEDVVNDETRTVLRLHPRLAPYKVAVLPLSKKDTLTPTAREVLSILQPHFSTDYDETQAIGRRYRRQDEIGTPYCVTIDFETLEDRAVTVRDRDSLEQDRISIDKVVDYLKERLP
ncbi:MAG: glycine--tRNA ligase, partial [Acidimicrobiia bacterium]|nr:glycine--tRNA ligase [Acidimicrobiia bacterium]